LDRSLRFSAVAAVKPGGVKEMPRRKEHLRASSVLDRVPAPVK
jgi:hypothetical protein